MADVLTPGSEMTYVSFPISKMEETADGDLIVWGKATDGTLDNDLQIVDPDWSAKALREWYDTGANVRVQHQAQRDPAGTGLDIEVTADGATWVKTLVVEPVAKELVRKKVLKDYSVGIFHPDVRIADPAFRHLDPQGKAVNGVITGRKDGLSKIGELSLVDRGSNFGTRFQLVKAASDGTAEFTGKMLGGDGVTAETADPELVKASGVDEDTLIKASLTFSPADLAKLLQHRAAAEEVAKAASGADEAAGDNVSEQASESDGDDDDAGEGGADVGDTDKAAEPEVTAVAEPDVEKRNVSTAERHDLAEHGDALPNESYPIANVEDLHNAAILARSGHGDVSAARALIAGADHLHVMGSSLFSPALVSATDDAVVRGPTQLAPENGQK